MKILNSHEMAKQPVGTLFCPVNRYGNLIFNGLQVITSRIECDFCGALPIKPFYDTDRIKNGCDIELEFSTIDDASYNYAQDTLFAVFTKDEVTKFIDIFKYALGEDYGG